MRPRNLALWCVLGTGVSPRPSNSARSTERSPTPPPKVTGWSGVVDESGEDYLFPEICFVNIDLPAPVARAIARSQLTRDETRP
jgi:hypothetical protein